MTDGKGPWEDLGLGRRKRERSGSIARVSVTTATRSIVVPAPPETVWSVVADPQQLPILDPRLTLLDSWGEFGTVGSGYVVRAMARRSRLIDFHYRVVDATYAVNLSLSVAFDGNSGSHAGSLESVEKGTRLTWTSTTDAVPFGTALLFQRPFMRREMSKWLEAVRTMSNSRR